LVTVHAFDSRKIESLCDTRYSEYLDGVALLNSRYNIFKGWCYV